MPITGAYWKFYVMGRDIKRLPAKPEFEESDLKKRLVDEGKPFRDVVRELCEPAVAPLRTDSRRKRWLSDNSDEIAEDSLDGDQAYAAYLNGIVDELAKTCDDEAVESLQSIVLEDPEDDDDDDDDEEEDDDEDDEEDEDEDD